MLFSTGGAKDSRRLLRLPSFMSTKQSHDWSKAFSNPTAALLIWAKPDHPPIPVFNANHILMTSCMQE